jgi:hypothetical protein
MPIDIETTKVELVRRIYIYIYIYNEEAGSLTHNNKLKILNKYSYYILI